MLISQADILALSKPSKARGDGVLEVPAADLLMDVAGGQTLEELLPAIQEDRMYFLPCRASWSMHHLLQHLVRIAGPSRVALTSWTITEAPVRAILRLMDAGLITDLQCVFDERVRKHNANAAQLAEANIAQVAFTGIHAKCMVVQGEALSVTVCSTANITRNKRIELYWLSTHQGVAAYHASFIASLITEFNERKH